MRSSFSTAFLVANQMKNVTSHTIPAIGTLSPLRNWIQKFSSKAETAKKNDRKQQDRGAHPYVLGAELPVLEEQE